MIIITYQSFFYEYLLKRIPNIYEITTNSLTKSTFDMLLGNIPLMFGDNPVASSIIRDFSKPVSAGISYLLENEVGSTGYKYDIGHLYASTGRLICNGIIIGGYYSMSSQNGFGKLEGAGRIGNYICESVSRFFIIASQEKKDALITDKSYEQYVLDNVKSSWYLQAAGEAVTKSIVTDAVGEQIKNLAYSQSIRNFANDIDCNIMNNVLHTNAPIFEPNSGIWEKFSIVDNIFGNDNIGYIVKPLIWSVDNFSRFINDFINGYIMAPPARLVQDLSGRYVKHLIKTLSDQIEIKSDIIEETCPNNHIFFTGGESNFCANLDS